MADLNALMSQIKLLSVEEQEKLNSLLVTNIKNARKVIGHQKSLNIEVGDFIQFDGGSWRGTITIQVDKFNPDHTKVGGRQINRGYSTERGNLWTVPLGGKDVRLISKEEGLRIAAS